MICMFEDRVDIIAGLDVTDDYLRKHKPGVLKHLNTLLGSSPGETYGAVRGWEMRRYYNALDALRVLLHLDMVAGITWEDGIYPYEIDANMKEGIWTLLSNGSVRLIWTVDRFRPGLCLRHGAWATFFAGSGGR
jgi:hypothetical protein